jgi:hypothetical protein
MISQNTLCQISVFPASFDLVAAQSIVKVEGEIENLLGVLRRRNLLNWDSQVQRYDLHSLIRRFAKARLQDREAQLRYVQFYANVAAHCRKLYLQGGKETLSGLVLYDRERAHIDAGWKFLLEQTDSTSDILLLDYALATADIGDLRLDQRKYTWESRDPLQESWEHTASVCVL